MANSDDEDAYLYSSEDEQPKTKKARTDTNTSQGQETITTGGGVGALEQKRGESDTLEKGPKNDESGVESDEEEDEESSDDDVEFVIGDPAPRPVPSASTMVQATPGPLNDAIGEVNDESDDFEAKPGQNLQGKKNVEKDDGGATIDVNAVAEYEGKPLTQLDLDELKEKPWRAPGADISDYFNYGFDEITWTAYCHKQDKLRGEFNPQKVMAKIMGGNKNQMPFPFPFMPNMPMPPNMAMPPNMPNMPNMQMPPNMPMPPGMGGAPPNPGFGSNTQGGNMPNGQKPGGRPQNFGRYKN